MLFSGGSVRNIYAYFEKDSFVGRTSGISEKFHRIFIQALSIVVMTMHHAVALDGTA